VRGITICGNDDIVTSSRDETVRLWSQDNRKFVSSKLLVGHTSFVGPLTWIPPNSDLPQGSVAYGGMDTLVLVWDLNTWGNFTHSKVISIRSPTLRLMIGRVFNSSLFILNLN
ncbi:hypothetical protein RYX36_028825, partial [Vicia faba]